MAISQTNIPNVRKWIKLVVFLYFAVTTWGRSQGATLTGAVVYSDVTAQLGDWWNTLGGDPSFNLYLKDSSGNFINTGNGPGAAINIPLSSGVYTYAMFGQPGHNLPTYALNLFFDGNNVTPRISVEAAIATSGNLNPPISAFGGPGYTLAIGVVPGASTLTYVDGNESITLTTFVWENTNVQSLDLVQAYDSIPGGGPDNIGVFTLSVVSVPEPRSIYLLLGGLLLLSLAIAKNGRFVSRLSRLMNSTLLNYSAASLRRVTGLR
jgi:hypothetical protein